MSAAAQRLIEAVRRNGGRLRVEDGYLVIAPESVALSIVDELRAHKAEIIRLLESESPQDPVDEFGAELIEWLDTCCAFGPRFASGVTSLHLAFCEWLRARDKVPPTKSTFIELISEFRSCFPIRDIGGVQMVMRVCLRSDAEAHERFQAPPPPPPPAPEKRTAKHAWRKQ